MALSIYIGNTTVIELRSLTNDATGAVITNAAVQVTLEGPTGEDVTGQTWPLALTHVSDGTYTATLENDLSLVAFREYTAVLEATVSGVGVASWRVPVIALIRTE